MKRCIFHYPHPIVTDPKIGSALRPNRMREAFEEIGYQVDEVTGYGGRRKEKIRTIKQNVRNGVRYDFVYSESINTPTLMAEEDHLPRHPLLDYSFFRFCRRNKIPVGLFYRDMHWAFPLYKKAVALWKRLILIPLFRYDLFQYKRTVDRLYVPSDALGELLPGIETDTLPPGGTVYKQGLEQRNKKTPTPGHLNVFYVGNVTGGVYDLTDFCRAVKETEGVYLTLCAPPDAWKKAQEVYREVMCDRIRVIHKASRELAEHYTDADIFCACLQVNEYSSIAMPIKVFEAIGQGVPVMISSGIAAAKLIEEENCGWCVENTVEAYKHLLKQLRDCPAEVAEKTKRTISIAQNHTWQSRAQKVADDLIAIKK